MVSNNNRTQYAYENDVSYSEEDSNGDEDYQLCKNELKKSRAGRKSKCFTKNALLARENRLKKKLYISNLENDVTNLRKENKKLVKVVDKQSYLITDLRKQLKYFKSVIANSSDISNLIKNINQSTGMSVSSSLDKNLSLKNVCVPKRKQPIARKTAHPWEDTDNFSSYASPDSECLSNDDILKNDELTEILKDIPSLDFPLDFPQDELMDNVAFKKEIIENESTDTLNEHNYTMGIPRENPYSDEDVGVCLHVSKHRLSLEFCSMCSENASHSWND